jgi:hypothetical protein
MHKLSGPLDVHVVPDGLPAIYRSNSLQGVAIVLQQSQHAQVCYILINALTVSDWVKQAYHNCPHY